MKSYVLFNSQKRAYLESCSSDFYKHTTILKDSDFSFTPFIDQAIKYADLDLAQERAFLLQSITGQSIQVHSFI